MTSRRQSALRDRGPCGAALVLVALAGPLLPALAAPAPPYKGKPPTTALYRPKPDKESPGALVMAWDVEASSPGVMIRSVSLYWATKKGGPWHPIPIPAWSPKTTRCTWQLPPDVPAKVYLRLTARDSNGRLSVAQTEEPCLLPRPR